MVTQASLEAGQNPAYRPAHRHPRISPSCGSRPRLIRTARSTSTPYYERSRTSPRGSIRGATSRVWSSYLNVYRSAGVAGVVPLDVVTETLTGPAAWAGVTATICLADFTLNELAVVVSNFTCVTPENPVPVMVTEVPPATGPLVRESDVMDVPEP